MKNNKKNNQFMGLLFVTLALLLGIFLVTSRTNLTQKAGSSYDVYTKIQGDEDLDRATQTLDGMSLDFIDRGIDQNSQDASSF